MTAPTSESLSRIPAPTFDITLLQEVIRGEIILPNDADYETARQVHNLLHNRYPALIARPVDANDVVKAVQFATENDLTIAVRGGAHSASGFGTVDDGIVIDLSLLRDITIDPDAHIARVQGGVTAGELTDATLEHGLIVPFGDGSTVGVGGITLGGGVGWLTRKLGMTIDSLLAAEIVTADGRTLHIGENSHPDLFWAIRGGGGNFGVVTSFEFKLHPIDTVLGGELYLPLTREVVKGVIALSQEAPDGLTTISMAMPIPPTPDLPQSAHGKLTFMVTPVWVGDLSEGQRILDQFRTLAEPIADRIRPMPFSEMYKLFPAVEAYRSFGRAFMADALDDAAIDAMIIQVKQSKSLPKDSFGIAQLRVLGGAMARVPNNATAFAHRDANLLVAIGAISLEHVTFDKEQVWVESLFAAMQHVSTGAYLNFLEDEGEGRIREAYPASTYQRLVAVKQRYDPENIFHLNQNIQPLQIR